MYKNGWPAPININRNCTVCYCNCVFPRKTEGVCFYRRWFVCLPVTTITKKIMDGFVPHFMGRFLGEREDQVRVSLRLVGGCGSNGQKTP